MSCQAPPSCWLADHERGVVDLVAQLSTGAAVTQFALQWALDRGTVIRPSRGLYCLPDRLSRTRVKALHAVVSHLSAAEVWELGVGDPEWVLSMVQQLLAQRGRSANQQEQRRAA